MSNAEKLNVFDFTSDELKTLKVKKVKAPDHLNRKDLRLTIDNPEDLVICRKIYNEFKNQAPQISLEDIITYLDQHPDLKVLTYPLTIEGYNSMYI